MKTLILLLILFCWSNFIDAQNVYIPDANFKTYLLNNAAINTNGDTAIQVSEAAGFTGYINVSYASIYNLTGIAAFTGLDSLSCSNNGLTNLNVSANTTLTYLNCSYNQLTNLNISTNTALVYLNCSASPFLSNLDVSANTILSYLDCSNNSLGNLNLSNNNNLTYLTCHSNNLTNLDLSANTSLTTLRCYSNNLINLNLSTNTTLTYLDCSNNNLTNLDLSINTSLATLRCYSNNLINLNLSTNTMLTYLDCSYNQLINLNVSTNTNLYRLYCVSNQLSNLDVTGCTALNRLECSLNPLGSLDVSKNKRLDYLFCIYNQLTNLNVTGCTALTSLLCRSNQLTNLDLSSNPFLTTVHCQNNQLVNLNLSSLFLTTLQCQNNPNLQCLPLLPAVLTALYTDVSCLPNIPASLTTTLPLCNSSNTCFLYPSITGHAYIDMNNNGTQDPTDFDATQRVVSSGIFTAATNNLGNYNLIIDTTTTQNISIQNFNTNYFTLTPSSIPITTTNASAQVFPNNDFRIIPIGTQSDAEAHIIGGIYRPGFTTTIAFVCNNVGNTLINPTVTLNIDPNLNVISSSIAPNGGLGNNMTYNLTNLAPFGQTTIYVDVFTPISLALGSPITNTISIAVANEVTPANNTFTENAVVIGSYDPNDKTADIDYITPTQIAAGKEINYTIRFQNTGTFPADFVIVTDTLDNDLDASSLELISTSHYLSKMTIGTDIPNPNQPNVVKWYFYNINLPDSASNEAGSHGYIRFSIRPKQGLPLGTLIENMAGIVFDFNTPVLTNTWVIPVSLGASTETLLATSQQYNIYPNPVEDKLFIQSKNNEGYFVSLLSINGQIIYSSEEKTEMTTLDMRGLQAGLYLVQIVDKQGAYVQKIVVE